MLVTAPEYPSFCEEGCAKVLEADEQRDVLNAMGVIAGIQHPRWAGGEAVLTIRQHCAKHHGSQLVATLHASHTHSKFSSMHSMHVHGPLCTR